MDKPKKKDYRDQVGKLDSVKIGKIKAMLLEGTSWREIKAACNTSASTISMISKDINGLSDEVKAQWQTAINDKLMQVQDKIADSLLVDDYSKLAPDKKAIALGIIHDKLHPKAQSNVTVNVAVQQTLDIARNSPRIVDV